MQTVSIIIPVYNTKEYISQCLDSVIDQTYENLEIIIIDDGSTDSSSEIIQRYIDFDSRIRLISQKNEGAASARNRGLNKSTGDYIFFVDSDDWLEKNTIELLISKIKNSNADLVMPDRFTEINLIGKKSEIPLFVDYKKYKSIDDFVVNIIIGQGRAWRVSSVLYKADIIKYNNIKFPVGHTAEDVMFNLAFLSEAYTIDFLEFPTLNVNRRQDSVTASYHENMLETYLLIDKKTRKYLSKVNYNKNYAQLAQDSLLCRNIILWIGSELSAKNNEKFNKKSKKIYKTLQKERVKEAFKNKKFIKPYWNSKVKVYYVVIMRTLIKYNLNFLAVLLAILSNKIK